MTQIKLRRDTSANFTSKNPVLGIGEPAYETDTKKLKIGDGTTAYTQLEYFSAGGGGSTNITATLPLKIVDGVISLEVDGQTIQIVDGKLHANLDELGNEVNDLSGRVTAVEADISTKADKSDLDTKEDVLKAIQPLTKTRTETNPVVGFTNNTNGKAWDTTIGSLGLKNMSGAGYCLSDDYGHDAVVTDSKLILKKYILIPYTQGQIVRIPAKVSDSGASYAVSLVNIDLNGNIDYISNDLAMKRQQPNLNAKGSEYVQSSQNIGAVTRISGAASTGSTSSVALTSKLTDSILIQLKVTDTKSTYTTSIAKLTKSGSSSAYMSTDMNVINRLKDVNALLLTRIGSAGSFAGMGVSESAPYDLSLIQVFEDDGTTLETLTDQVGFVNSHTNIYDATKNIIDNSLSLNIGSGLSVVDGKLTAAGGITTLSTGYQDLPLPTREVWYKSPGNGYIAARFTSSGANQFCQLGINSDGTGIPDSNSDYDGTQFSQGPNNKSTIILPISKDHYYSCNWNYGGGIIQLRFIQAVNK